MKRHKLLVSARQLSEHLDDPTWRIVDCRFDLKLPDKGHADYLAGHIPGATYADLDRDLAAAVTAESGRHPLPDPADFAATLGALGIDGGTQVVAYDNSGGAIAARLWWWWNRQTSSPERGRKWS
jgi:thiosulfate/3-mercaptopyruvate sulfurtransferase